MAIPDDKHHGSIAPYDRPADMGRFDVPAPLTDAEVAAIAEHERLTPEEAAVRGAALMAQPHGDAALRQIVWDNLVRARQFHDTARITALEELYRETCRRHPNPCDRRLAPTRITHPFNPPLIQ
ncbi:hypothetical protein [Azospirillum halopraeferens]|uniref:hypothetical protein n=1 Tax=Azospirillum halopraeferens TaxID=34010 RepID=UPI0004011368|nr:hypothetical protein [Azospirillum halopraeferens]